METEVQLNSDPITNKLVELDQALHAEQQRLTKKLEKIKVLRENMILFKNFISLGTINVD